MRLNDLMKGSAEAGTAKRRVVMELDELIEADVSHISLVERGANRAPFKVVKRGNDTDAALTQPKAGVQPTMDIFKSLLFRAPEAQPPLIGALLVAKPMAEVRKAQIENDLGLSILEVDESAKDFTAFKLAEFDQEDALVVKASEDTYYVIGNVKKQFMSFPDSTSFRENIEAQGFIPGLHMVADAMFSTAFNILEESKTKADAGPMLDSMLADMRTHVMQLFEALPEQVFKSVGEIERVALTVPKVPELKGKDPEADKSKAGDVATPDPDDESDIDATLSQATQEMLAATMEGPLNSLRETILEGLTKNEQGIEALRKQVSDANEATDARLKSAEQAVQDMTGTVQQGALEHDSGAGAGQPRGGSRQRVTRSTSGGVGAGADPTQSPGFWDGAMRFPGFEIEVVD